MSYTDMERHLIMCITRSVDCTVEDCKVCGWNKYEPSKTDEQSLEVKE